MAFACLGSHQFVNSTPTLKLNNGSKIHHPNFLLQNPKTPSFLSFTHIPSLMRSCSIADSAHGFGINYRRIDRIRHRSDPKFVVRSSVKSSQPQAPSNSNGRIIFWSAVTLVLAVGNRVLYKLALVPMKEYPFFMAQVNTFGYVVIYFSILYARHRAGIVTEEMMALPKLRFAVIGMLEALGVVTGMYAAVSVLFKSRSLLFVHG